MDDAQSVKTPVTIYCDLSKAFDCLNFDIFLSKIKYYEVSGTPLALVKSYLTNRYQYVYFENCKSELLEIKAGIPQGSILGPLIFSILINDIVNLSNKFSFFMYADDTTIYFNLEDFPAIHREHEINKELEKLNIWFQLNKLTLNPIRSELFQTANDPGGGGGGVKSPPPPTISKTIVSIFTISYMCILLGVLGMFQLEFFKNLQF